MSLASVLDNDDSYFSRLKKHIASSKSEKELFLNIVDGPYIDKSRTALMSLGLIVLVLVNKKTKMIDRVELSTTDFKDGAFSITPKNFYEIKIPYENKENYIAIAIKTGRPMATTDWKDIFIPDLNPEEARFNQAGAGAACSVIYPLIGARDGGALVFSFYEPINKIGKEHHIFMEKYARLVASELKK